MYSISIISKYILIDSPKKKTLSNCVFQGADLSSYSFEGRGRKYVLLGYNQMAELPLPEALEENLFPCVFLLLELPAFSWLVAPPSMFKTSELHHLPEPHPRLPYLH